MTKGIFVPITDQISPSQQISYILSVPLNFITVLFNSIIVNFHYYLVTFVGFFGWVDVGLDTPLPDVVVFAYLLVLILAAIFDENGYKIKIHQKVISLFIVLIMSFAIFVIEYLLWTPVGSNIIDGVLGRYFIPFTPLLLLLLLNKWKVNLNNKDLLFTLFIVFTLIVSVFTILNRFYG